MTEPLYITMVEFNWLNPKSLRARCYAIIIQKSARRIRDRFFIGFSGFDTLDELTELLGGRGSRS